MPTESPWYENFFNGFILDAQRRMYPEQQTAAELAFIQQELSLAPGAAVLDVPCGHGRLALPMAKAGYAVTGVDFTEALLADCRAAAAGGNFERRDMRDLPWPARFDGAYCVGNSFGYFDEAGNEAFLRAVHAALKPGGRFVIEVCLLAEVLYPMPQVKRWFPFGDTLFLHDTASDPFNGKQISNYILIKDGQVERKQAVYQLYTLREVLRLMGSVGFTDVAVHGGLTKEPFKLGSPGAWLVMRRGG